MDETILTPSGSSTKPAAPSPAARSRRLSHGLPIAVALATSLLLVVAAASFQREPPPAEPPAPGMTIEGNKVNLRPTAPQWSLLRLEKAMPARAHWTEPIPARVAVDETRAYKVGTPLPGRVVSVFVELGQAVKTGDPLFSVASPSIAELSAEVKKAQVDYEVARAALERVRAMVAVKALPAKEELTAEQQFREAEINLKMAKAKLRSITVASKTPGEFTVTAKRDGVVVEKRVLVGQQVTPESDTSLLVIADLSSVWVIADVFEADAVNVREGARCRITSPSLPDVELDGRVAMVSAVVDPNRHTVPIRVLVDNKDRSLKPNAYVHVSFEVPPRPGAVEVEASALVTDGRRHYVYVQEEDGGFARREVVAGSVTDGMVQVLRGLRVGETIVAEGAILLDNELALSR